MSEQLPAAVLQRKAKHGRRDRSGDVYAAMAKAGRSPAYIGLSKYFAKHVDSLPGFRAEMLTLLDDAKRDSDTGDGVDIRIPHRGTLWVDYGEWADLRRQLAKDDERYVGGETGFVKDEDDGTGISGMTAAEEEEARAEHLAYDSGRR